MPHDVPTELLSTYEQLAPVSATLARHYVEVAAVVQPSLTPDDFTTWSQYCVHLASADWRAWECAEAFLRLSPFLVQRLTAEALWRWAEHGQTLAQVSAEVAAAFFHAAKPWLQSVSQSAFAVWIEGLQSYLTRRPAQPALAREYLRLSPVIYSQYALQTARLWSQLGAELAQLGAPYGQTFFVASRTHLDRTPQVDYTPAWEWAQSCLPQAPAVALAYLERYADLLHRVGPESAMTVAGLLRTMLPGSAAEAQTFLRLVSSTLGFLPAADCVQALAWCQRIVAVSPSAVLDFLHRYADLSRRLPGVRLKPWIERGLDVARHNTPAGEAYFALESATAQECLHALQSLVTFEHVAPVLRLYTEAMLGQRLTLRTTAELPPGLHMAGRDLPTSDGTAIFVPEQVSDFATARDNFAAYKVAILHQVGRYECGTFRFACAECVQRIPRLRQALTIQPAGQTPADAFTQFYTAFPEPELARSLFALLEDARIDAAMARRYKGIQHDLTMVMAWSLRARPALSGLPLRQALLEGLLQCTLGLDLTAAHAMPPLVRLLLQRLWQHLQPLQATAASVYDTAAAVLDCYVLITQIPLHALTTASLDSLVSLENLLAQLPDDADSLLLAEMFQQAGAAADMMPTLPESDAPATGVEPVPYRGEVKPELIQKTMRLQELAEALKALEQHANPLPPEVLQALLEKGDMELKSLQAGHLNETSGLFVTNLEGRDGLESAAALQQAHLQHEIERLEVELQRVHGNLEAQRHTFLYDEWDYLIGDYRRAWCRLSEMVLDDAGTTFVEDTLQRHAALLAQVSRQLQLLKPETYKPLKRLVDGEEIDLDSAIEALVDRRATQALPEKVYMRRQRRERSVAALFLLDMSASTDDAVPEPEPPDAAPPRATVAPRPYDFSGFVHEEPYAPLLPRRSTPAPPKRRIIDVEREALVLMAEALEGLGDAYAVYGFSGYGRDQVECFVVKEFAERYDARIQGKIGAMKPQRSTRMGPAIRHAITKLAQQDARLKLLLLLSDGYPQDYDYGKDRKSKDYGIHDTAMALHETRQKGIQTFCITVDPAGHDYLRAMCPDQQYLVLEDMASLPKELPKVYRSLTT